MPFRCTIQPVYRAAELGITVEKRLIVINILCHNDSCWGKPLPDIRAVLPYYPHIQLIPIIKVVITRVGCRIIVDRKKHEN
ncbi:hypothetical protein D3C80_1501520 [compost metagenome]